MTPRSRVLLCCGPAVLAVTSAPVLAQFTDATGVSGLQIHGTTWGAALGDLDGDGDLEIYCGRHLNAPVIFWNLGETFSTSAHPSPFSGPTDRHGVLLLPIDDDPFTDLLILHGANGGTGSEPNELYLNDGAGTLTPIPGAGGMDDPSARGRCIAAADFDGDGRLDVWAGNAPRASDPNALFRNTAPLSFSDASATAGLDEGLGTVGGLWGDFDDDGDPDLFVGGEEFPRPSILWRNDGGTFADASGLFAPPLPVVSGADWGDLDGDGDLDLAVCDGRIGLFDTWSEGDTVSFHFNTRMENGVDGLSVPAPGDSMLATLRLDASATASDVFLGPAGVHPPSAWSVVLTDAYVGAPVFTPGVDTGIFVWRTAPGGSWEIRCSSPSFRSHTFDGLLTGNSPIVGTTATDLEDPSFVAGGPRVWRNDGGQFAEVTEALGLPDALLNPRDISCVDFDNDGDLDLHVVDMGTSAEPNAPDALFRNDGGVLLDVSAAENLQGGSAGMGDGGVWGDVDGDLDLDLYLQEGAGPASFSANAPNRFLRNDGDRGNAILLDLVGTASGTAAVGAKVTVAADPLRVHRVASANAWRGFQDPLRVHVGLGTAVRADSLTIEWPSGGTRTFMNPFPGSYVVREDDVLLPTDLAVTCSVDDAAPALGDTVSMSVTVANVSAQPVSGVGVTHALPVGLSFEAAAVTAGSYAPATAVWTVGPLAAGADETLEITATVDEDAGGLTLVAAARLSALALDRPDTMTANDSASAAIIAQGVLALSSSSDQAFQVAAAPTAIAPVTVTEHAAAAGITAANDLRVRIPAGFPMSWDTADTLATISGPAAAKVAGTVTYDDVRTLVMDVITDFGPNDRVTISGLSFADFVATAPAGRLELQIGDDGAVTALDDKTISVFQPTAASNASPAPMLFALGPVSPNPFRGATSVQVDIPIVAPVRLGVHDVSGRLIRVLIASTVDRGRHHVMWDGRDTAGRPVATGVYFFRLEAGGSQQSRKAVVLH
ncbi:MAG: FG-GAP-like repeat-containing protein [Candidatus Eiseniibacteriota bacterium]